MSHTNQTPKLQLAQFVANDKPTWLGDWNSTMLTIDNAVGTVQENLATAEGVVEELTSEVSELNTEVNKVKPDNTGIDGNVLKKTSNGATWSTLEASNVSYSNSTVDAELTKVNNELSLIGATDFNRSESVNIPSGTIMSLAQLTLTAGVYVVVAYAQYASNSTGVRALSISNDNQHSSWSDGHIDVSSAPQGTTKLSVSKIVTITNPTTIYCNVSHNANATLACFGALQYVKIK